MSCSPFSRIKMTADDILRIFFFSIRSLQRQLELAHKRNNQLNEVVEVNKGGETSPL